jgi:arsenate reductase
LLVTLDAAALAARPPLRAGLQHRHYPFEPIPDVADKAAWRELAARIRQRVEGMIGGMHLLQKAAHAPDGL